MPLDESSKREYAAEELAVLGGVIDYADRMIYEDQHLDVRGGLVDPRGYVRTTQAPLYRLLRKNAYAKTVVIDTELQGRILLRLSPTEVTYPNYSSGYCTPHSPQGRLASFVQPGYTNSSKLWGEYEVVEVRSFDRFGGADFEPNVRNFLRMSVGGQSGDGAVTDLQQFLRSLRKRPAHKVPSKEAPAADVQTPELEPVEEAEAPSPQVTVVEFEVVDEPDGPAPEMVDESEEEWDRDSPPVKADEYYGLSERFFTHQTEEQNQVISRSPLGPMFVEGVAGSGKTSAALGRTKMLTTFNAASVVDEQAFRDLLGPGQDYWSAEFAGQFSQESCVGFVRTGELIQYLQETCRRIDLPDLPVQEFKELQARLREHRKLTRSFVPGRRWTGVTNQAERNEVTTMAWLRAADQAIARRFADHVLETIPTLAEVEDFFQPAERPKVARVVSPALALLRSMLSDVAIELRDPPRDSAFALDRLTLRLANVLTDVRRRVTGPRLIWTQVAGTTYHAADENNLARQLVEAKAPLYLRTGQRVVFVDGNGLIDSSLQLVGVGGMPVAWDAETKDLLESGQIVVRDSTGQNFKGVVLDVNQLFLRLLPEASDRIYSLAGGKLRPLPREHGWGRVKLQLLPAVSNTTEDEEIDEEPSSETPPPDQPRYSTADAVFARVVQGRLFRPLTALPDLYLDALRGGPKHFPVPALVQETLGRFEQFKLADQDIDLLLCLAHLIGRGLKQGGMPSLREPTFYQAVFVDEVQDFTEQQVYLMVEQSNPRYRAITVVGDYAQKLHHGTTIDLRACFPGQTLPSVKLTENLRQGDAPALALFSALFRTQFFGDPPPSDDLKERALAGGQSTALPRVLVCAHESDQDQAIIDALRASRRGMTVAVLFPNSTLAAATYKRLQPELRTHLIDAELSETVNLARRHVRHFADVANAKGLEFDSVIVAQVDEFNLDEGLQVNRLYVGLTRARRSLTVLAGPSGLPGRLLRLLDSFQTIVGPEGRIE